MLSLSISSLILCKSFLLTYELILLWPTSVQKFIVRLLTTKIRGRGQHKHVKKPSPVTLKLIFCHRRNIFNRNQAIDTRSHGFGNTLLLIKCLRMASDMTCFWLLGKFTVISAKLIYQVGCSVLFFWRGRKGGCFNPIWTRWQNGC